MARHADKPMSAYAKKLICDWGDFLTFPLPRRSRGCSLNRLKIFFVLQLYFLFYDVRLSKTPFYNEQLKELVTDYDTPKGTPFSTPKPTPNGTPVKKPLPPLVKFAENAEKLNTDLSSLGKSG